jgi:hypothetical protein
LPRIFVLCLSAAAATAATAVICCTVAATAATVAGKKERRDDDYPNKAFVIEKIANAVHKKFLPIYIYK